MQAPAPAAGPAWPWEYFQEAASALPPPRDAGACPPAVLLAMGALSPCHLGHVEMMQQAKERLQDAGYEVCAGWLSPCCQAQASAKAQRHSSAALSAAFRLRLAELCAEDCGFLSVASWEALQGREQDYLEVVQELQRGLAQHAPAHLERKRFTVFVVCGSDEKKLYSRLTTGENQGLVVVPRQGDDCLLEKPTQLHFVAQPTPGKLPGVSSTRLRTALQRGDSPFAARVLPPAAVRLLLEPSEAERREFAEDFKQLAVPPLSAGPWPFTKLAQGLLEAAEGRVLATLVVSGAMSPVHRGHVLMLHQAKARLEQAGYLVVAAWLSPAGDAKASKEAKLKGAPELRSAFRQHVAELSVCNDGLVAVGSWEAGQAGQEPKPREVAQALYGKIQEQFRRSLEGGNVKTFYVCGSDQAVKQGLQRGFQGQMDLGVVIVPRDDDEIFMDLPHQLVYLAEPLPAEGPRLSSTALRGRIAAGDAATAAKDMAVAAARFTLAPTPAEFAEFRRDFEALGVGLPAAAEVAQTRQSLAAALQAWLGPGGTISWQDLGKLLQVLDPSWTGKELDALMNGVVTASDGSVSCDDFVNWIFSHGQQPQEA